MTLGGHKALRNGWYNLSKACRSLRIQQVEEKKNQNICLHFIKQSLWEEQSYSEIFKSFAGDLFPPCLFFFPLQGGGSGELCSLEKEV